MDLQYSASRILHNDHMASLGLLTELERLVLTKKAPPPADDPEIARFLARLRGALAGEIVAHFDFEEEVLFPVLIESGQGDLCDLLVEEHHVLRETMRDVVARVADSASAFSLEAWSRLRGMSAELVERLQSHIEKEERALVPAIEEAFTPEIDSEACARHEG